MFAAENWCIKVEDKIYGPYTSQQMLKYAHAGRLSAASLISPAGSRSWRKAHEESTFASFFGYDSQSITAHNDDNAFGKSGAKQIQTRSRKPGRASANPKLHTANFVVVFDVINAAASHAESAIRKLGHAFRIADNVWVVNCDLTAVGVRNALAPYLNPRESLFVVDSSTGRTSWQNYPPSLHAKISEAYKVPRFSTPRA